MKKRFLLFALTSLMIVCMLALGVSAAGTTHTVVKGDTMWKLAVRYEVGLSEIKLANPHIENPDLIYPVRFLTFP